MIQRSLAAAGALLISERIGFGAQRTGARVIVIGAGFSGLAAAYEAATPQEISGHAKAILGTVVKGRRVDSVRIEQQVAGGSGADVRTQQFFLAGANPSASMLRTVWQLLGEGAAEDAIAEQAGGTAVMSMSAVTFMLPGNGSESSPW